MNLLKSRGLTENQTGNYRGLITAFTNVAETTEPDSALRAQRVEEIALRHEQPNIDQALLLRPADMVFTLHAQRN